MTSILRRLAWAKKNDMLSDVWDEEGGWGDRGLASVLVVQSLFLLLKKIGFAP